MSEFPSKGFKREEFACKCGCGFDVADAELLKVLIMVRNNFRVPVRINSACRCSEHNARVGGSPRSQHLLGKASDIVVSGVTPQKVYDYLVSISGEKYGIGNYNTFTHIDVRSHKARF